MMYRIGEFSKLAKMTIKTLRYYDEIGLLKPCYIDQDTGYRYYKTSQLVQLQRIVSFKQIGLSIEEILAITNGASIDKILEKRKLEIKQLTIDLHEQLSRITYILKNKEDFLMKYQVIIKDLPECMVYYRQGVVPTLSDISQFIMDIENECINANPDIKRNEMDYCYVLYLDEEFKTTDVAIEYAQAVTSIGKETENVKFKKIDSVNAACVLHEGSYDKLHEAYAYIMNWVNQNGYQISECPRERYIDGIWNKKKVEDWLTEIEVPIIKK